mgnify:CR=1 FL=1
MEKIPDKYVERAKDLAAQSSLSAEEILERALSGGLDAWEKQFRSLQRGMEQAKRGEFIDNKALAVARNAVIDKEGGIEHDDMMDWLDDLAAGKDVQE